MWAINHNARASCFGRRHFKGITPAMSQWLNSACKIMAWKYFSDQIAAFWQLQEVNHYQRKLFSDIISVCSGQEYSQFISLILCSALLWVFYYCFLKIFFFSILFWSRKNILFFWDILACARGLVAWYQKPFSHRLTFKHTLKSYWNQRALEVRLKLSICVMLCWEGAMSLGRCLMLHITWTRQSNFMLAFWVYFNVHSPSMLNGLSTTVL